MTGDGGKHCPVRGRGTAAQRDREGEESRKGGRIPEEEKDLTTERAWSQKGCQLSVLQTSLAGKVNRKKTENV